MFQSVSTSKNQQLITNDCSPQIQDDASVPKSSNSDNAPRFTADLERSLSPSSTESAPSSECPQKGANDAHPMRLVTPVNDLDRR